MLKKLAVTLLMTAMVFSTSVAGAAQDKTADQLYPVEVNGKYGYIDKNGNYLIKPQFSMAQPFSEGLAFVERNGATFYINKKGAKVIQGFTAGGLFKGGLAPASTGQRYGYINTSGRFVVKPQLYWANEFNGELAEITLLVPETREEIRGYMNRSGTIVWPLASELPAGVKP